MAPCWLAGHGGWAKAAWPSQAGRWPWRIRPADQAGIRRETEVQQAACSGDVVDVLFQNLLVDLESYRDRKSTHGAQTDSMKC